MITILYTMGLLLIAASILGLLTSVITWLYVHRKEAHRDFILFCRRQDWRWVCYLGGAAFLLVAAIWDIAS